MWPWPENTCSGPSYLHQVHDQLPLLPELRHFRGQKNLRPAGGSSEYWRSSVEADFQCHRDSDYRERLNCAAGGCYELVLFARDEVSESDSRNCQNNREALSIMVKLTDAVQQINTVQVFYEVTERQKCVTQNKGKHFNLLKTFRRQSSSCLRQVWCGLVARYGRICVLGLCCLLQIQLKALNWAHRPEGNDSHCCITLTHQ